MKQRKFFCLVFLLYLAVCLLLFIQGCATKGFVEQKVKPLETRITDLSSRVEGLGAEGIRIREDVARLDKEDTHIREEITRLDKKGITKKVIASYSIMFGFGRWRLTNQAKETLDQIAQELSSKENLAVFVIGHTDSVGPEAYNLLLGQRRAQIVAAYLLSKHGVLPYKVYVESLGEYLPKAPNKTPSGRSENRRAEIILVETNLQ